MAAAIAGSTDANISLNQLAGVASMRHAWKHGWHDNDTPWHPRPPGPSPHGFAWNHAEGQWISPDGQSRPEATRSQRRVQQRKASEVQTLRHKRKWELYDSCERRRRRHKGQDPVLTAQEQKAFNAGWRLHTFTPKLYASMGYNPDADRALCDRMGNVMAAARQREADARAAIERQRAERDAAYRTAAKREADQLELERAAKREADQLELERVAPERLAEGKRLTEGFAAGGRVEFRTWLTFNLKTGKDLDPADQHHTEWQPGSLTKVVSDGHVKSAYGLAWLEVRPDDAIPGYYLRHGHVWGVIHVCHLATCCKARMSAGVYERVCVLV